MEGDCKTVGLVADLLAEGTGTVINFGSLGGETSDIRLFPPRSLTLKGVVLGSWMQELPEQRRADIGLAQRLAQEACLFEVAERYPPARIAQAVAHVGQPGRTGQRAGSPLAPLPDGWLVPRHRAGGGA